MNLKYGQFCPIAKATEILGERWTILIVRELLMGTTRFTDFQRALSKISPTLLTKRLGQLVDSGLAVRKSLPGGKRVEYHLTAAGKELGPIITSLGNWGMRWARGQMDDDELDVELLMVDFCRRLDLEKLPGGTVIMHFSFQGLSNFPRWWIIVENGECELCVDHPGRDVDVTITTDVRSMVEYYAGDTTLAALKREGKLQAMGAPELARTISNWMPQMALASIRPAKAG